MFVLNITMSCRLTDLQSFIQNLQKKYLNHTTVNSLIHESKLRVYANPNPQSLFVSNIIKISNKI